MHFPLVQTLVISLSILISLVAAAPTPSPEAQQNRPSWKREPLPSPEHPSTQPWRRGAEPEPQQNRPSWKRDAQDAQVAARSWSAVVPPNKFNRSPDFIVL
ncbi:hypothetical protein FA13DRAFT_1517958 [Coprinellus micaceus]|uniref:Uncharacterized protein n=1 Tax=Coprinellus micaceus TaxID=71717 RepID=A0A4Y7SKD0_COPMI|nr:hypothetical protein FA13DRAFT_1819047 [Coprinellus micaceus]TEB22323.1 hypothetical protein FA13DRAFT_1517958 [Coprinellus micaceus]